MPVTPIFAAQPPEVLVARLLTGPGIAPLTAASTVYSAIADELNAAAANVDSSMNNMGGTWVSLASDKAQGAFRNHAMWLREQALVAENSAAIAEALTVVFTAVHSTMTGVAAWLAEYHTKQAATIALAATGVGAAPALAAEEAEYLAIWTAAEGVMNGYAASAAPLLGGLQPPTIPAPSITSGGMVEGVTPMSTGGGPSGGGLFDQSAPHSPPSGPSPGGTGPSTGGGPSGPDPTVGPHSGGSPVNPDPQAPSLAQPGDYPPGDPLGPNDLAPPPDPGAADSLSDPSGYGDMSPDQGGLYGVSQYSPTLAGLNGGVGSMVSLSMTRGGVAAMPGAATGFRMPANWTTNSARAFGPPVTEPQPEPIAGRNVPRGASAPAARMRRRRDDEKKSSKVFVPGDHEEVPVLEKPSAIGVIEYTDSDIDVPVLEPVMAVGVIEQNSGELLSDVPERAR